MSTPGHFSHRATDHASHHASDHGTVDVEAEDTSAGRRPRRRSPRALITDATRSPELNRRSREKQYLFLQGIRVPLIVLCLVAAFAWHNWWLACAIFAVSVPLPWISVMIANGQGEVREKRERNVYKPAAARAQAQLDADRRAALGQPEPGDSHRAPRIIEHDDLR